MRELRELREGGKKKEQAEYSLCCVIPQDSTHKVLQKYSNYFQGYNMCLFGEFLSNRLFYFHFRSNETIPPEQSAC